MPFIVLSIIAAALFFLWIESPIWRKQRRRDRLVFFLMLLAGAGLNIIQFATYLELPNPSKIMVVVYKPVSDLLKQLLQV
ncbi:hypothetical protein [Paenibacillus mucilaginosus]|uniref:Uncharacterized protein n=3 Tax=Paenibacillus mucilaginosus TaxID=61624 RepID=H6NJG0_9BACL|nr:hypothetical protein [Paenibacillus mucilaginosus]AEI40621.1 hypothetical protein KNP414_02060 [Paenibacillus mucilaginosus KNP414]AFC29239.1 hypothetical protein PM3016_2351 [Paenibacillus mucilaginosus 3016]AFH61418.1 hypothetical protein B2K_11920 [Paenibacillus mucilaginosus K02]MCG7216252.1 hypothetical protein [Paenibacillus mucilaginosus]WDM29766.1 hypothetical protein KCX80_11740 [Paenibacillus mucilaginosus]